MVAVFHSLKMQPIFMHHETYSLIREIIETEEELSNSDILARYPGDLLGAIQSLCDNRVLSTDSTTDGRVLDHFRSKATHSQITIAYFILAESCNMSCSYCFEKAPSVATQSKLMNQNVATQSIEFFDAMLRRTGHSPAEFDIIFYGGEPLLNYSVLTSVAKEVQRRKEGDDVWTGARLSMVTNGTLLTPQMAQELNELSVGIGLSIDGPKRINDANRFFNSGASAFESTAKAIEICKSASIDFSLSVTLSTEGVQHYHEVMSFIKTVNPTSVGFNILMAGKDERNLANYNKNAAEFMIKAFIEFRDIGIYEDRMMRKVKAFANSEVYPFDCGATGGNQVVFSPAGQVGICHGYLRDKKYFPTLVSNLNFDPSEDDVFVEWSKRSPLNMEQCQTCPALGLCGGGCPMSADQALGSIWELDERFCVHAKTSLEWLVWELFSNASQNTIPTNNLR